MQRRRKKPAVSAERASEWLRRSEGGESAAQIARTEGYDPRTVRSRLEATRQEREMKEARSMVLRQALEQHYGDLVALATELNTTLTSAMAPVLPRSDRRWIALKQHLPRSPLWRQLDRWDELRRQITQTEDDAEARMREFVQNGSRFGFATSAEPLGLHGGGLRSMVINRLRVVAEALDKTPEPIRPLVERTEDGYSRVICSGSLCAVVAREAEASATELVEKLSREVSAWPEAQTMRKLVQDTQRTVEAAMEELATITLRRVVPGRCRYCPF